MKRRMIALAAALCMTLLCGCAEKAPDALETQTPDAYSETTPSEDDAMKNSEVMLRDKLKISEERAQYAMEILTRSGASGQLKKVKLSDQQGIEALVTDDKGDQYYCAFDDMGFIEVVREGSQKGKVLFGVLQ